VDESCISAIPAFENDIMCVHDVSTLKVMQFAPLLNDFWKKFLGDI
jgi:hypothetical protein